MEYFDEEEGIKNNEIADAMAIVESLIDGKKSFHNKPLVIHAVIVEQLRIRHQQLRQRDRPRVRVRFRIIDRDVDLEPAEIHAAITLGDFRGARQRAAESIEPSAVLEADRLHDESIALPSADRIAVPRRFRFHGQRPAVREDLSIRGVALVEDHDKPGKLEDFPRRRKSQEAQRAARRAARRNRIVTAELRGTLLEKLRGPRLVR